MKLRLILSFAALVASGCDAIYGVQTRASLPGPVDVPCVDAALASVVGAGRVDYKRSESRSVDLSPKRRVAHTVMHVWSYDESAGGILQINQTLDGWNYVNGYIRMGSAVTDEEIASFQPKMVAMNRVIQSSCGLPVGNLKPERLGSSRP